MSDNSIKIAHLGFIQGVIARMGSNSFAAKGWCVAIIAALLALVSSNTTSGFIWFAMVTILVFWWLDAFFLRQERLYRKLYDAVVANSTLVPEFSMDTRCFRQQVGNTVVVMFSQTLLPFYVLLTAAVIFLCFVK